MASIRILSVTGVFAVFACWLSWAYAGERKRERKPVPRLSSIRKWTKVNPQPLKLPTPLNLLCAPATLAELPKTSANPHRRYYFTVYVNKAGKRAMLGGKAPTFPKGSVIVKEKLPDEASKSPELLTAMVKRERGYDPNGGDWEYAVLDGAGDKVIEAGKLTRCASCHSQKKESDYVFRTYLPTKKDRVADSFRR